MERFFGLIDRPSTLLTKLAGIIIMVMMLHISADVAAKYLLNDPIDGTLEIVAAYYMVVIVFFPLAYVTHHEGHIKVELFTRGLSKRTVFGIDSAVAVIGFFYMALLTVGAFEEAIKKTAIRETWETADDVLEVWPSRWLVPLGCFFMAAYLAWRAGTDARRASSK